MTEKELMDLAAAARKNAYAPYSGFTVGAALLCGDGRVYTGCNVENAAFSPSVCAERVAVAKAVSEGCRTFAALAVTGGKRGETGDGSCTPCGVCRQVLAEFCPPDFPILLGRPGEVRTVLLKDLLPMAFSSSEFCKTDLNK